MLIHIYRKFQDLHGFLHYYNEKNGYYKNVNTKNYGSKIQKTTRKLSNYTIILVEYYANRFDDVKF